MLGVGFAYRIIVLELYFPFSIRSPLVAHAFLRRLPTSLHLPSFPSACMVSFSVSHIRESHLYGLQKKGFIP